MCLCLCQADFESPACQPNCLERSGHATRDRCSSTSWARAEGSDKSATRDRQPLTVVPRGRTTDANDPMWSGRAREANRSHRTGGFHGGMIKRLRRSGPESTPMSAQLARPRSRVARDLDPAPPTRGAGPRSANSTAHDQRLYARRRGASIRGTSFTARRVKGNRRGLFILLGADDWRGSSPDVDTQASRPCALVRTYALRAIVVTRSNHGEIGMR